MGLQPEKLYTAMLRFEKLGSRGRYTHRVPLYQVIRHHAAMVVDPKHPYHLLANTMVKVSEHYPRALFRPIPTWFKELTYEPVTKGVKKGMNAA
jgi:hypothetical protein